MQKVVPSIAILIQSRHFLGVEAIVNARYMSGVEGLNALLKYSSSIMSLSFLYSKEIASGNLVILTQEEVIDFTTNPCNIWIWRMCTLFVDLPQVPIVNCSNLYQYLALQKSIIIYPNIDVKRL